MDASGVTLVLIGPGSIDQVTHFGKYNSLKQFSAADSQVVTIYTG